MRAIWQWVPQLLFCMINLKTVILEFRPYLIGANGLKYERVKYEYETCIMPKSPNPSIFNLHSQWLWFLRPFSYRKILFTRFMLYFSHFIKCIKNVLELSQLNWCYSLTSDSMKYDVIGYSAIWICMYTELWMMWTVHSRYVAVIFFQISHERHPIARPLGRGMGCLCEFKVWSKF